ncbi:MAG: gliding motility-associated C-terminal domain-containing protein, partial [Lewinella sp.]|nr:gliding motility-associated C-terminal domain-containing protein [Lewinella sp.]
SSQMQMANNGFLYFVSLNQDQSNTLVGEIRCPVTATPSVDFELFSYENTDTTFFLGLPNYTDHIFRRRFQDSTRLEPDTLALCAGEMFTLTARIDGPEYLWSTGDTGPSITISQGGDYHVTVTDECGYLTIDNFLVDDLPLPSVEIFFPDGNGLCAGSTLSIQAEAMNADTLYWSTGDTAPQIEVSAGGTYTVTVANGCGEVTASATVDDLPDPTVAISFPVDIDYCIGDTISIFAEATNADTLFWSTGDTTEELPLTETGMYTVTAANACGEASETGTFTFIDCEPLGPCSLQMPNVFSPNKDGTNDLFGAFTDCEPEEFQLRVYSRWGKLVFDTNDYTRPWEGLFNDEPAPAEVYLYRLVYRLPGETEVQVLQGDVTLVR